MGGPVRNARGAADAFQPGTTPLARARAKTPRSARRKSDARRPSSERARKRQGLHAGSPTRGAPRSSARENASCATRFKWSTSPRPNARKRRLLKRGGGAGIPRFFHRRGFLRRNARVSARPAAAQPPINPREISSSWVTVPVTVRPLSV